MIVKKILVVFLLFLLVDLRVTLLAQDTCNSLIDTAIDLTSANCSQIDRNEICYGHNQVGVTSFLQDNEQIFQSPGDIVNITEIQGITVGSMELPDEWGIALMRLQANLPETLPGEAVTMIVFGGVQLENAVQPPPETILSARTINATTLRTGPDTTYESISGLDRRASVTVDARNVSGSWVRVTTDTETVGWVTTSFLRIQGDIENLFIVDDVSNEVAQSYGPMQAFYLRSGIGEVQCENLPPDGVLIQTPEGVGRVEIVINQVTVNLGSTLFITSDQVTNSMAINVLEGSAVVIADDTARYVLEGSSARVPLGNDGLPLGPPTLQSFTLDVNTLPIELLPEQIVIASELSATELSDVELERPSDGTWFIDYERDTYTCPGGVEEGFVIFQDRNVEVVNTNKGLDIVVDSFVISLSASDSDEYKLDGLVDGISTVDYIVTVESLTAIQLTQIRTQRRSGCTIEVRANLTFVEN